MDASIRVDFLAARDGRYAYRRLAQQGVRGEAERVGLQRGDHWGHCRHGIHARRRDVHVPAYHQMTALSGAGEAGDQVGPSRRERLNSHRYAGRLRIVAQPTDRRFLVTGFVVSKPISRRAKSTISCRSM